MVSFILKQSVFQTYGPSSVWLVQKTLFYNTYLIQEGSWRTPETWIFVTRVKSVYRARESLGNQRQGSWYTCGTFYFSCKLLKKEEKEEVVFVVCDMFIYLSLFCFVLLEFSPSGIFYTWTISAFDYAKYLVFGLCSVRLSFAMESERRQRNSNTVIVML